MVLRNRRPPRPDLAQTLFDIAFLVPQTAVMVKRFNDRDWPQYLPYGYALVFLMFTMLDYHRIILAKPTPSLMELAFLGSMALVAVIVIIDNGFLRGTVGPNRYGPDPLAEPAPGTAGTGEYDLSRTP